MGKWEEINELEVEDLEDMVEFSVEYLTWTEIWGTKSQLFHNVDFSIL